MKLTVLPRQSQRHGWSGTLVMFLLLPLALVFTCDASAQVNLTGTNYVQNFNSISNGLPAGWTVRTNATASSLGAVATFPTAAKTWGDTGGEFGNLASLINNLGVPATGNESSAMQSSYTNRIMGIRQTGTFGDPGAAFVFQIADTVGLSNLNFTVDLNLLRNNAASTTWALEYAVGNVPGTFVTLGTYSDPGAVGSSTVSYSLGMEANDQSANVWIRIVALTPSAGGTRDTFGIDNFELGYEGPGAPSITGPPIARTNAVLTTAIFAVAASGAPPLFYQWYKDGIALTDEATITGAASDTLTISHLFHTNAGDYTVVVTNAELTANSVTSAPATLTVVGFAIAPITPTNTLAGTPVTVGFNIIDNQTPVTTVTGVSSNQSILPDANISGAAAGNSGTVELTPLIGSNGVVLVNLLVSDGTFFTNSIFPVVVVPSSDVVFNDHFDYANGLVTATSFGVWRRHSGSAGDSYSTNGALLVSRSLTDDVNALLIGQPYATNSMAVLYSRFVVRFSALPAAGGGYFAHFKGAIGLELFGRVWASTSGAGPGAFRLGIGNADTSGPTTAQFPQDLGLGTSITVVTRYDVSNAVATLWLNPTAETDLNVVATDFVALPADVISYAFRQAGSMGIMQVDDLVVGTTFAAVASTPSSIPLTIEQVGNDAVLTWTDAAFKLQAAPSITGTYTNVPNAVSPHPVPLDEEQRYFRLIFP